MKWTQRAICSFVVEHTNRCIEENKKGNSDQIPLNKFCHLDFPLKTAQKSKNNRKQKI